MKYTKLLRYLCILFTLEFIRLIGKSFVSDSLKSLALFPSRFIFFNKIFFRDEISVLYLSFFCFCIVGFDGEHNRDGGHLTTSANSSVPIFSCLTVFLVFLIFCINNFKSHLTFYTVIVYSTEVF